MANILSQTNTEKKLQSVKFELFFKKERPNNGRFITH